MTIDEARYIINGLSPEHRQNLLDRLRLSKSVAILIGRKFDEHLATAVEAIVQGTPVPSYRQYRPERRPTRCIMARPE